MNNTGAPSDLWLKQLQLGPMANFVYLIGSRSKRECAVVDPAWDVGAILDACAAEDMRLTHALVTHYHPDHCGGHLWGHDIEGIAELTGKCSARVCAHVDEADGISHVTGVSRRDMQLCRGGDRIEIGDVAISMIHTPGHTPGSMCFHVADNLVAGDTLFLTGCGRVDLPGGSSEQLFESLSGKIARLPEQTMVWPGHHYDPQGHAPLAEVKRINPWLKANTRELWQELSAGRS